MSSVHFLLPCCCMHLFLLFDMQHDPNSKKNISDFTQESKDCERAKYLLSMLFYAPLF